MPSNWEDLQKSRYAIAFASSASFFLSLSLISFSSISSFLIICCVDILMFLAGRCESLPTAQLPKQELPVGRPHLRRYSLRSADQASKRDRDRERESYSRDISRPIVCQASILCTALLCGPSTSAALSSAKNTPSVVRPLLLCHV